jgi:hypothetical protein
MKMKFGGCFFFVQYRLDKKLLSYYIPIKNY